VVIASNGFVPEVLWEGSRYALAWKNDSHELRYAYLPRSGALALSEPATVSETFDDDTVSLAPLQPGRFAIVYTRVAYEPQYGGVPRAFMQQLGAVGKRRSAR
jgi:hypothetical protein